MVREGARHAFLQDQFIFLWIASEIFADSSEVEVRFIAQGPLATLVELEHRNFERLGAEAGASMRKDVDGGWPGMLEHFKREAETSSQPTQAAGRAARI